MIEKELLVSKVQSAQNGDADAATWLYETFQQDTYYFILKTVNNDRELAEDLTQDTFVEVLQTLDKLQEPAAFVTWIKQIAYHKCTAHFRKRKELLADEDEDGYSVFDTILEENQEFIPDEALDNKELKQAIMNMVNELPEEQRAAILLRYFNEISVKEIAEIQSVSEGTVKSRLNYARKAIKQSVEAYEKKSGIKLHCAGVIPLLLWMFREYRLQKGLSLTAETAKTVFGATSAVTSAASSAVTSTATTVAASTATGTASVTAGTSMVTAGKTALAVGAKALATKVIAAVAALTVVTGGVAAAVTTANQQEKPESTQTETLASVVSTDTKEDTVLETVLSEPTEETSCDHAETERVDDDSDHMYIDRYDIVCLLCGEVIEQNPGTLVDQECEGSAPDEVAIQLMPEKNNDTADYEANDKLEQDENLSTENIKQDSNSESEQVPEETPEQGADEELGFYDDECETHNFVVTETWTDPNTGVVYTFHTCTVCSWTYSSSGTPGQSDYEVGNGAPDGYYEQMNSNYEEQEEIYYE